jgi:hypothetical protein
VGRVLGTALRQREGSRRKPDRPLRTAVGRTKGFNRYQIRLNCRTLHPRTPGLSGPSFSRERGSTGSASLTPEDGSVAIWPGVA